MYRKVQSANSNTTKIVLCCVVAILMIGTYIAALTRFENPVTGDVIESSEASFEETTERSTVESVVSETSDEKYEYYDTLVFERKPFDNDEVFNGPLAIVGNTSDGVPAIDQSRMVNIGHVKTGGVYGLSNMSLVMYDEAIAGIDRFIVAFYDQVPRNGLIINKGYVSADTVLNSDTSVDLITGYSVQFSIYDSSYSFKDDEFAFLRDQAHRYGVIQRYPEGKEKYTLHEVDNKIYRYVGLAHSAYMNHYMYSLEEYIDYIRTCGVIEYKSELENDTTYVIYYVPVDGAVGTTYVDVPAAGSYPYTVSGDGNKGFIVTVKITE